MVHVVRFVSLYDVHSKNVLFKWSKNGKWPTGDLVGPGDPGVPSGESGQDNQSRYAFRKSMVLIKLSRKVEMSPL